MAKDDMAAQAGNTSPGSDRAIRTIAALHDAIRAVPLPRGGDRAPNALYERLATLLAQSYNQLLGAAVSVDAQKATQLRFDVIGAMEPYESELAQAGITRTGEGGLSVSSFELARAAAARPGGTARALREAASACAALSGYICRGLAGLGIAFGTPVDDLPRTTVSQRMRPTVSVPLSSIQTEPPRPAATGGAPPPPYRGIDESAEPNRPAFYA